MYIKYDKPIVGRDPMGRPLPHWRAELARRQGLGVLARGWEHFCAPHPYVAYILFHAYNK